MLSDGADPFSCAAGTVNKAASAQFVETEPVVSRRGPLSEAWFVAVAAGAKMIGQFAGLEVSTQASLGVVAGVLGGGVGLSLLLPEPKQSSGT